jgi:hypothetical protein
MGKGYNFCLLSVRSNLCLKYKFLWYKCCKSTQRICFALWLNLDVTSSPMATTIGVLVG